MKLRNLGVIGAAGLLSVTAIAVPAFAQDKTLKIGIELPLSGNSVANGGPTKNGVLLAIQQANASGKLSGYTLVDNTQDDAVAGVPTPQAGRHQHGHPRCRRCRRGRRRAPSTRASRASRSRSATRPASPSAARPTPAST